LGSSPALDETNPIPGARRNKPNPRRSTKQTQSPALDETNPIPGARRNKPDPRRSTEPELVAVRPTPSVPPVVKPNLLKADR